MFGVVWHCNLGSGRTGACVIVGIVIPCELGSAVIALSIYLSTVCSLSGLEGGYDKQQPTTRHSHDKATAQFDFPFIAKVQYLSRKTSRACQTRPRTPCSMPRTPQNARSSFFHFLALLDLRVPLLSACAGPFPSPAPFKPSRALLFFSARSAIF